MTESGIPYKKQKPKQPPDEVGIHPPSPDIAEPHREMPPPNISIPNDHNSGSKPQFLCQICGKAFNTSEELQAHTKTEHAKTAS
jgi:hypothetical protein